MVLMNIGIQMSERTYVFISFGNRIVESYDNSVFNFLRNCQTIFQSIYIILHPLPSQYTRISISLHPCQRLLLSIFFIITILVGMMEKAMAPHSSTVVWKIPWMEEPGRLQSMGLQRVGHNWATSLSLFTFMRWRRKWQPTPVFLPGESQGRGSLVGCHLWGLTEPDTT